MRFVTLALGTLFVTLVAVLASASPESAQAPAGYRSSGPTAELAIVIATGLVVAFTFAGALYSWWPKQTDSPDDQS